MKKNHTNRDYEPSLTTTKNKSITLLTLLTNHFINEQRNHI